MITVCRGAGIKSSRNSLNSRAASATAYRRFDAVSARALNGGSRGINLKAEESSLREPTICWPCSSIRMELFMTLARISSTVAAICALTCALSACADVPGPPPADLADSAALSARVAYRLAHDTSLDTPILLSVQARNHVVFIYGTVSSESQRELAASLAAATQGVEQVKNLMTLAG